MELAKELFNLYLRRALSEIDSIDIDDLKRIVESESYRALRKIKEIICDDSLEDSDCFDRIEKIVCLFDEMGIDSGGRHDF